MQAWHENRPRSLSLDPILVLGPDDRIQNILAREIESLPASVLRADSLQGAHALDYEAGRPPSIVLIPEVQVDAERFEDEIAELRVRTGSARLTPIAFGRQPDEARRLELRQAGVDLALFGRFGRHSLRFQINRALSPWASRAPRGELRAPMEWRTRTYSSGKEKTVRCYSLSSQGAFFVTPRPWVVGSKISLELPIGRTNMMLRGKIVYTVDREQTGRRGLPSGMAVAFEPLSDHLQQAIREDVTATQQSLQV